MAWKYESNILSEVIQAVTQARQGPEEAPELAQVIPSRINLDIDVSNFWLPRRSRMMNLNNVTVGAGGFFPFWDVTSQLIKDTPLMYVDGLSIQILTGTYGHTGVWLACYEPGSYYQYQFKAIEEWTAVTSGVKTVTHRNMFPPLVVNPQNVCPVVYVSSYTSSGLLYLYTHGVRLSRP